MSSTVEAHDSESTEVEFGGLAMVHIRVLDADRDAILRFTLRMGGRTWSRSTVTSATTR